MAHALQSVNMATFDRPPAHSGRCYPEKLNQASRGAPLRKSNKREELIGCIKAQQCLRFSSWSTWLYGGSSLWAQQHLKSREKKRHQAGVNRGRMCTVGSKLSGDVGGSRQFHVNRLNDLYSKGRAEGETLSESVGVTDDWLNLLHPLKEEVRFEEGQIGVTDARPKFGRLLHTTEKSGKSSLIKELPLCFVPWTLLPGSQEMLHVYEPHNVHLFETLLSQPQPWRYGHMLTSPSGRRQSLIGVLAEVQEVERYSDGRMLLLISATAKIRVLRPSQRVPFFRATVEREQDEEESLVGALYSGSGTGLEKPFANKNGVRSSGPEWDPEVAAAAVMTHELRRRERELWDCYDQVRLLTGKLRMDGRVPSPPSNLLSVLPPGRSPIPNNSPRPRSVEQKWEDPADVVSRVQRLSYHLGSALPAVKRGEGRQEFLEAGSIRERMDLAAAMMTTRCKELAARVAVKRALADTSTNLGS